MSALQTIAQGSLLVALMACHESPPSVTEQPIDRYPRSAAAFFEPGTFLASTEHDEFLRRWYGAHLTALREPSLQRGSLGQGVVYRFLWLRTFEAPISIRWESLPNAEDAALVVKSTSGHGGYDTGRLVENRVVTVRGTELTHLNNAVRAADLWSSATNDQRLGVDGAQWVFESAEGNRYHVVRRWSPNEGPIRSLGQVLLALAQIQSEPLRAVSPNPSLQRTLPGHSPGHRC